MTPTRIIFLKRIVIGLTISVAAVAVTTWSLTNYVPNVSPIAIAVGAWFATFYTMTMILRSAVREAHRAGEVGRRLPTLRRVREMIRNQKDANADAADTSARPKRAKDSLATTSVGE